MSRIFKNNLSMENYTPFYDHYNRFFTYLKETAEKVNKNVK